MKYFVLSHVFSLGLARLGLANTGGSTSSIRLFEEQL